MDEDRKVPDAPTAAAYRVSREQDLVENTRGAPAAPGASGLRNLGKNFVKFSMLCNVCLCHVCFLACIHSVTRVRIVARFGHSADAEVRENRIFFSNGSKT